MPAAGNRAPTNLRCEKAGCESRTYSTPSNLARHIQAKHGEPVQMPCGIIRQDHQSNSRRHQLGCSDCRTILGLPSLDALGSIILNEMLNEVGNTIDTIDTSNAVGAPVFDDNLGEYDITFDSIGIPVLDDTIDEFDDALAVNLRDYNNSCYPNNEHYPGFL
ncbi:hypothetical protein CLIM01_11652 [Colletotrichum limetticola]|uniref:C2H2-type domain-containing protein n=1 Tax=Colletotrichum limetticola TaxID=1209924 RepID=A0ABQ9PG08_9PEZI|nr:hypothetical protein CLIM01_11652 [Colletotrichum limetticola]